MVGINANVLKTEPSCSRTLLPDTLRKPDEQNSLQTLDPARSLALSMWMRSVFHSLHDPEMVHYLAGILYILHALTPAHESSRAFVWTECSPKRWGLAASRCSIYRSPGEETEDDKHHVTRASPAQDAEVSRGCFGCRLWVFSNEASKQRR